MPKHYNHDARTTGRIAEFLKTPTCGVWHVTTEGDCEGRSTKDLGVHQGELDEIAFNLAPQCYYSLNFKAVDLDKRVQQREMRAQVHVQMDISSGLWDVDPDLRAEIFSEWLKMNGRTAQVKLGQYYASVRLIDEEAIKAELLRQKATSDAQAKLRAHMSAAELELLGIKF